MSGKSFLIDTTRCTACRGCQIACKNWNGNGASMTKNLGSHQNPPDLDSNTYKLVRFSEAEKDGKLAWYFFPDGCRHCMDPPCKDVAAGYVDGAVIHDEATGSVVYTEKIKTVPFDELQSSCPYDIPRKAADGRAVKCTMCIDRVSNGLTPACVKSCPTGAMNFGDREEMLALGKQRIEKLQAKYPSAQLLDSDNVRAIYLVTDEPAKYHKNASVACAAPDTGVSRKMVVRSLIKPVKGLLSSMRA